MIAMRTICWHRFIQGYSLLFLLSLVASNTCQAAAPEQAASGAAVEQLQQYLKTPLAERMPLPKQAFAGVALTRADAKTYEQLLWQAQLLYLRKSRQAEMTAKTIKHGQLEMPFFYAKFGTKPACGRIMYISMHVGGGAPKQVNDQQWENHKRLYRLKEGVYVVPRAPTNTWNLWHQGHIDPLFDLSLIHI